MLTWRLGQWFWDDAALGLSPHEAALLTAMAREVGRHRPPHRWIALSLRQPVAPTSGHAYLRLLARKLEWAGAPTEILEDSPHGVGISVDAPIGTEPATRQFLSPDDPRWRPAVDA